MAASLTYSIFDGTLTGFTNGRLIHISALSGGGGGSTLHRATLATNNPYNEGLKTSGAASSAAHIHGGPIPPGRYGIETPTHHPHLGLSARLANPYQTPHGRDGFYIHGRGPHGSDGCIVPIYQADFKNLMDSLTADEGGELFVEETETGDAFA